MKTPVRKHLKDLKVSATLRINQESKDLIEKGVHVFKLGLGQSPFPVHPLVNSALKMYSHEKDYLPVDGLPQLREAICKYFYRKEELSFNLNQVVIGPGSKELIFLLQMVHQGTLIALAPSWVSYVPQAKILKKSVHISKTLSSNDWKLNAEDFDKELGEYDLKGSLLIFNYPNNPVGNTYSEEELVKLAAVFEKYELIVVSDEIYAELNYENSHKSLATFYPAGTITSTGLSKWCGAGGWRLGALLFPECLVDLKKVLCGVASETFTSVSAPIQYASVVAYQDHPEITNYVLAQQTILKGLGLYCHKILSDAELMVPVPQGGFYLLVDFSNYASKLKKAGILSSKELCSNILSEIGVAVLPGTDFNLSEDTYTARMAFVNFNGEMALEAFYSDEIELNDDFLKKYCSETVNAFHRIAEWVRSL